jgi:hypothetical protein
MRAGVCGARGQGAGEWVASTVALLQKRPQAGCRRRAHARVRLRGAAYPRPLRLNIP